MIPPRICYCSFTFLIKVDKVVASSSSSSKGSISIIEMPGVTSTTLGFLAIDFLATVLISFLPEDLAPMVEAVGSTSLTSGVLLLVEV
jgi:hypothetical protein